MFIHQLSHFSYSGASLFYGKLLRGDSYTKLSQQGMEASTLASEKEIMMTERIVGVMTGVLQGDASPEVALQALQNLLSASGEKIPSWFTGDFVVRVKELMPRLLGEWKGTPFGESMTLEFSLVGA